MSSFIGKLTHAKIASVKNLTSETVRTNSTRFSHQTNSAQLGSLVDTIDVEKKLKGFKALAKNISTKRSAIHSILSTLSSYPAVEDELSRTMTLLENLNLNKDFFGHRIGVASSITPRNQILYSITYAGLVLTLQFQKVHLRPPKASWAQCKALVHLLELEELFPELQLHYSTYDEFTSACLANSAMICFFGKSETALRIRKKLPHKPLFLCSGAGHNPVVVTKSADLASAAKHVAALAFHNQGQDCSAPNAILVERSVADKFKELILVESENATQLAALGRHPSNRIGPNTDIKHLNWLTEFKDQNRSFLICDGMINFSTGIALPSLFCSLIGEKVNFEEFFAPYLFLHVFDGLNELNHYFGDPRYSARAMYVTIFSDDNDWAIPCILRHHPADTVVVNNNLHEVEIGYLPYGGYGIDASYISIAGTTFGSPILPQREAFRYLIAPQLEVNALPHSNFSDVRMATKMNILNTHEYGDNKEIEVRLEKLGRARLTGLLKEDTFNQAATTISSIVSDFAQLPAGTVIESSVTVLGRISSIRNSGMFANIKDEKASIQLFCNASDDKGVSCMSSLDKLLDVGDWIEATGPIMKTKRGELSVRCEELFLISKCIRPLPEKFHGLKDRETTYRNRHLDILSSPESKNVFLFRSEAIFALRARLRELGFVEVETSMLQAVAGGASARPFSTLHNALNEWLYLRIAPELELKKLLIGGLNSRLFEINRNFRNEGLSARHNPEFTMLEAYQSFATWRDMMDYVDVLLKVVFDLVNEDFPSIASGQYLVPKRVPMHELVKKITGIDFLILQPQEALVAAEKLGVKFENGAMEWGHALVAVFEKMVEEHLIEPIHVTHHPVCISPLAKVSKEDSRLADRFETYFGGIEIANGYSEENDPIVLRSTLTAQVQAQKANGNRNAEMDESFIEAVESGMPPAGGLGIGIDRLVMLATGRKAIRDVILFPTLRKLS